MTGNRVGDLEGRQRDAAGRLVAGKAGVVTRKPKAKAAPCEVPYPPSPDLHCVREEYHPGRHLTTRGRGSQKQEFSWPM